MVTGVYKSAPRDSSDEGSGSESNSASYKRDRRDKYCSSDEPYV